MTLTDEQGDARAQDPWPQTMTLTEVEESEDSFTLTASGTGFALKREHGVVPKVGDTVTLYYVTEPENVYREHGAMVPLMGCDEYGCAHPREGEEVPAEEVED